MNSLENSNKPNEKRIRQLLCERKKKKVKKSICTSKSIKSSKTIRLMEKKCQMNVVLVEDEDVIHK